MIGPGIAATLAVASATLPAAAAPRPIYLTAAEDGGLLRLQVRGDATAPVAARFTLEAVSGSNRSTQRGTARLVPGTPVVLVSLNLSGQAGGWSAVLHVEPDGAAPYELRLGAAR